MSARRTTARFCLATALIGSLALTGAALPAAAAGEPDGLYSTSDSDGGNGFVQLDKTDATATAIGPVSEEYVFTSVEVVNGVGYAIGYVMGDDDVDDMPAVFTWDIATGAVLTAVAATLGDGPANQLEALDTLADGTLITYVEGGPDSGALIVSIDFTTGALAVLIDTDTVDDERIYEGLATNPVTGITYVLADYDDGIPAAAPVDFAAGTIGESIFYEDIADSLGGGWFTEGDFDADGVLWFTYSNAGVSRTDGALEVGVDATELGDPDIISKAITIGQTVVLPAPAPQLAATGLDLAPVIGGAAVLFALGGGLLLVRRRTHA
jgi:hypothetical protein